MLIGVIHILPSPFKGITKIWYGVMNLVQMNIFWSIGDFTIFIDRGWNRVLSDKIVNDKLFMLYSSLSSLILL